MSLKSYKITSLSLHLKKCEEVNAVYLTELINEKIKHMNRAHREQKIRFNLKYATILENIHRCPLQIEKSSKNI